MPRGGVEQGGTDGQDVRFASARSEYRRIDDKRYDLVQLIFEKIQEDEKAIKDKDPDSKKRGTVFIPYTGPDAIYDAYTDMPHLREALNSLKRFNPWAKDKRFRLARISPGDYYHLPDEQKLTKLYISYIPD